MNKTELIDAIAKKVSGASKGALNDVINAFTETAQGALRRGESVALIGFGTFSTGKRAARVGRNPRTGEALKIPATKTVRFRAGAGLKKAVNKK